ncbi:Hsp70 family protein [Bradyrhizobium sp. LHD-71]|uniref:Hsp70 family protein n=1 Tax=Bradyrhizobium sp. LHD-71 TaxID=3072141 RepID=UPI00280CB078|nr:Hsp70 family protein [Bradyrhizobium sp. LHD-71]MDQ8729161.1 Hsp70 family protein [Bradyrhizobium sp. LHD-71]
MTLACGIDFGTSNSSIAACNAEGPRLLPIQGGATSVPTALFVSFDDNSMTFGHEALERYFARDPGRYLRAIKSVLGTHLFEQTTQVRLKRYAFGDIIAAFLRFLRTAASEDLGTPPTSVVLGRPAFFVDDDPDADAAAQRQLETAARTAGFERIAFQFEPIAAALDYEQSVNGEEIALVADIGGGTSDFSVVRVSPERARSSDRRQDILGFTGVHIGGTDFDKQLGLATVMPALGLRSRLRRKGLDAPSWYFVDLATWHKIGFLYDPKILAEVRGVVRDSAEPEKVGRLLRVLEQCKGHELLAAIEAAKIELSSAERATLDLDDVADINLEINRAKLEAAVADNLQRIRSRIDNVLQMAGLMPDKVAAVFLTGGATRMPSVRKAIAAAVPNARLVAGDAFGSVATGLALDATRRFGER